MKTITFLKIGGCF